jgi:transmembrane sensor
MAHIKRVNSLHETAAHWFDQVREKGTSAETRRALNAWLAESAEHATAYGVIERTWSQLKSAAQAPPILELRHETAMRVARKTAARRLSSRWAAVAMLLLSIGTTLWVLASHAGFDFSPLAWPAGETHIPIARSYATQTGDRLTIVLDDGSQVTLNTATELDVTFSKKSRTVRLSRGQALFEVAKDPSRPFVVQTENRRFVAVGTAFDVRLEGQQVKVTMLEGTVRAEGTELDSKLRTTVTAGEQLISGAHADDQVRHIDPERETSWRHGQVIFENTPLGEAIDELNRYSPIHIALADPKLAELRLSGTFATAGTGAFVEAITAYFSIQIEHTDARTITLKARP